MEYEGFVPDDEARPQHLSVPALSVPSRSTLAHQALPQFARIYNLVNGWEGEGRDK